MIKVVFCKGEEVVYCKDCVHRPVYNKKTGFVQGPERFDGGFDKITFEDDRCPFICGDKWYSSLVEDNFYCAYGEKRWQ